MGTRVCVEGNYNKFENCQVDSRVSLFQERIRVKSIAFEHKAKEIKERLARIAEAEERFSKRASEVQEHAKYDSDSDKLQKSKSRKNDGEEKYEQIYSVSSSYGEFDLDMHDVATLRCK